jgi:pimeloyl-ACP methyl ester carboxylesterase
MSRLAHDLRKDGYVVSNLAYPSQRADIRTLANVTLGPVFAATPAGTRIHIVTHSLGGILVRQYLHDHGTPASLGRIVMLAPPNGGSELVDHLRNWSLYRWINGPAGLQLGTDDTSVPRMLGPLPPGTEVGIIAGSTSLNPLFSALINGPDDGKVSVARTHLRGESAHLTVPHSHTWLMWRRPVLTEIQSFLRTGRFTRPTPPSNAKSPDPFVT